MLSPKLLKELDSWEVVSVPNQFYHGCRSEDVGIDIQKKLISGNKWFSTNPDYAGDYAWHHSRGKSNNLFEGYPYRLELSLNSSISAVQRPSELKGMIFLKFLADCFPQIPQGYELSKHFQNVLSLHLQELNKDLVSYLMDYGEEILIPSCESYVYIKDTMQLPNSREEYRDSWE